MQRIPVESSDIVAIGYDEPSRILEIEFQNDRVYQYKNVEPEVHAQLMRADSYGQFFSTFITRRYRYQKVEAEPGKNLDQPVAFVTGNSNKFKEMKLLADSFGFEIEQLELPVDEIQSEDAEEIAIKKAKAAYKLAVRPVVVNDTFWNILALRGFPGAYMSTVTKWFRAEDFLRLMNGKTDRNATLTETVVYYDGKRPKVFTRDYRSSITREPKGQSNLSIDEVVILAGETRTLAELRQTGVPVIDPKETAAYDFAKWFNMHRRIKQRDKKT